MPVVPPVINATLPSSLDTGFRAAQNKPRGHLRVDIGASLASLVIIPALPEFLARYPDIRIDFGVSGRHVDLISDNVDCVIRGGVLTDLSLVARQNGHAQWVTCATRAYLDKHGVPLHPRDLESGQSFSRQLCFDTHRPPHADAVCAWRREV